jgi:hypothetical protein
MDEIGRAVAGVLSVYFMFDFFLWNGGLVNPSIFQRISDTLGIVPT